MASMNKAPRGGEPREALKVCLLPSERPEGSLNTVSAQARADHRAAVAHHRAAISSSGAHRAGELALARFYGQRAAATLWRAAA